MNAKRTLMRRRTLYALASLAALLVLAILLTHPGNTNHQLTAREGQAVFPRLERQLETARIIRVRLADLTYTLKRESPASQAWVMIESGDYPVRPDRLSALATGLADLRWGEKRTEDKAKFDRIGLGDPSLGGNGAHLEIMGENGVVLASLITGRREDRLYARFADEDKSFRVNGDLPPLYTREAWLDLSIVEMLPEVIGTVRITDARGRSLFLRRPPGSGPRAFRPAPPYETDRLVSRLAASGPALALSRFAPIDVKPAAALETSRVARHITTTHDGLEVDVSAYREPDGFFITLRAVEAGEGAARAGTINASASGWAFRLTEFDWNDFTPRVRSIVRRPAPPADTASSAENGAQNGGTP